MIKTAFDLAQDQGFIVKTYSGEYAYKPDNVKGYLSVKDLKEIANGLELTNRMRKEHLSFIEGLGLEDEE